MNAEDKSQVYQVLLNRRQAIADDWYKAIAQTSFVPHGAPEVRQHLVELTEQAITVLLGEPFEPSQAEAIGVSLAGLHYVEAVALSRTQEVLGQQLVEGLPAEQVVALQPRLAALLGGVAAGFFQQARETIISEQEWILGALIRELQRAEEVLRETEERYRTLFEGVPVGLYRTTPKGQILDVNPALVEMLGFPDRDTALAANAADGYANPEDRARWRALMDHEGVIRDFEAQWRRYDGKSIWVKDSARCVRDADGQVLYYEGSLEEITQRKRAEQALQEAYDELENRVQERTKELAEANEALKAEITERKRAEEEIKQRNRELSALNAIAAAVSQSLDLDEVLSQALDKVLETMELEAGVIRLLSENRRTLDLKVHRGVDLGPRIVERISRVELAESSLAEVVANGEPLVIEDLSANPIVELIGRTDLKSLAAIPLRSKGQVLGTMEVVSLHPRQFTSEEMELLTSIGNQIVVAIQNAQLWCETKRRLQEGTVLLKVSQGLASVLELGELLQLIVVSALAIIPRAQSGVIHLLDEASGELYPKALAGWPSGVIGKERMGPGKGVAGCALEQGEVINVPEVDIDPRFIKLESTHQFKSLLVAPLVADGKRIGTISVKSREIGAFTADGERLLMTLASHAATAVRNAQLFARLEELAAVKERNRIACEIHDGLAQNLASLSMKIDYCLGLLDSDLQAAKAVLSETKVFVQANIQEIRRSIFALHPPALKELGFLAALRKYAQEFQEQNALPVHLAIVGEEVQSQVSLRYEYELFRIVQESLNNVRRHARAKNVWITLDLSALDVVSLTVMDDGLGFDGEEQKMVSPALVGGFGLESMKERAKALGGKLLVETEPGSGTKITAILPLGRGG
jgi:PAS domain S-box-containing protein